MHAGEDETLPQESDNDSDTSQTYDARYQKTGSPKNIPQPWKNRRGTHVDVYSRTV